MSEHVSTNVPPLDLEGFRTAMRAAGIEEIVEPTLAIFVEESVKLIEAIENTLGAQDGDALRRAAHTLKGASGNVHATALSKVAASMEHAAAQGDYSTTRTLLPEARREHGLVMEYLREHGIAA